MGPVAVRARAWTFTLNNYEEKDIEALKSDQYDYIFQEETGKNGTPHLQGVLKYKNPRTFLTVKRLLPKAHIEVCKNWHASVNYCKKGDTRTGEVYTNMKNLDTVGTVGTVNFQKTYDGFDVMNEPWYKKIREQCEETKDWGFL